MSEKTLHTPEPWAADGCFVRQADRYWVVGTASYQCIRNGTADANARRIAACVNACQGIPTEALEAGALPHLLSSLPPILSWLSWFRAHGKRLGNLDMSAIDRAVEAYGVAKDALPDGKLPPAPPATVLAVCLDAGCTGCPRCDLEGWANEEDAAAADLRLERLRAKMLTATHRAVDEIVAERRTSSDPNA